MGAWERLSAKPKHVRSLILNGGAAARAELQWLRDRRPEQDVIADSSSGAPSVDLTDAVGGYRDPWTPQIIGEKAGRIYFLEAHEVEYLASAGNYVIAHVGTNGFLARVTLKCMSARLTPLGFMQIERSLLVNLRQVAYVERLDRGQFCFVMRGGARLVSSRERSPHLRAFFLGATSP